MPERLRGGAPPRHVREAPGAMPARRSPDVIAAPVSAAPGYTLYYLWAMAGDQRKLALYEDPAHRWIHDQP